VVKGMLRCAQHDKRFYFEVQNGPTLTRNCGGRTWGTIKNEMVEMKGDRGGERDASSLRSSA
jgi:hypothetical protein